MVGCTLHCLYSCFKFLFYFIENRQHCFSLSQNICIDCVQREYCSDIEDTPAHFICKFKLKKDRGSACHSIQIKRSIFTTRFHPHQCYQYSLFTGSIEVTLDQTLAFKHSISNICKTAYFELRRISSVHHSLRRCRKNACVFRCSIKAWLLQLSSSWPPKVSF